jgi:hypothetical protein
MAGFTLGGRQDLLDSIAAIIGSLDLFDAVKHRSGCCSKQDA